jgi:hypothetical protein
MKSWTPSPAQRLEDAGLMQWGRKRLQTGYRFGDAKGGTEPLPGHHRRKAQAAMVLIFRQLCQSRQRIGKANFLR